MSARGIPDRLVAEAVGVPRRTVSDWRRAANTGNSRCPRCWKRSTLDMIAHEDYALILGAYLGDGYVARGPRTSSRRITLDVRYPNNAEVLARGLQHVFARNRVSVVRRTDGAIDLKVYSCHMACLLPQVGAGPKHQRAIVLEPWQERIVEEYPWRFLRGLLWTDGCRFLNRTGPYEYASWDFCNFSADIRALFCQTCDAVDVQYRTTGTRVRVYQRASVATIDTHVGPKA